jgi:transposase
MYIRRKLNKSGSTTIQIIRKENRKNKILKTIGTGSIPEEIEVLYFKAKQEISRLLSTPLLLPSADDSIIEAFMETLSNSHIRVIGPELVFGKLYDHVGYGSIKDEMLRHLTITRLVYPGSKLKTLDYLQRYRNVYLSSDEIYRFLDKLSSTLKERVEEISFEHTKRSLGGDLSLVFYDMTTLYFEAEDEDDIRRRGFSKDGKHQNPQIFIGLLVGKDGFPIGYDIFEGNTFEGHTLIPMIGKFQSKFSLSQPVIIADAGLLSKTNISDLKKLGYKFILGGRIKNESVALQEKILSKKWDKDGSIHSFEKQDGTRLIVSYSEGRSSNDLKNRKRGLARLEKAVESGRLNKSNINNRGYNRYLSMCGNVEIKINYDKFENDRKWDGLKGYITNSSLSPDQIINNYGHLWQIEKAFRISKTDLKIRPIYHRLINRIEAHICVSFMAYSIYKELEKRLKEAGNPLSVKKACETVKNIYQIEYVLPDKNETRTKNLKMDDDQELLCLIASI